MPDLLQRAADQLQTFMERDAATEVTYTRPNVGSVEVLAIIGETRSNQDLNIGIVDRILARDYIIRQSLLVINDEQITPQRNDRITQVIGSTTYEAKVLGENGLPHYEETDGHGVAWRIHTKRDEVTTS